MASSLLITLEYPPDKGGVASYYKGIVEHWPQGELQALKLKLGAHWLRWRRLFFEVSKVIKQEKIKTLQVGQVLPLGIVALILKWTRGTPYFVYTHGMDVLVPQKSWRKKFMLKTILQNAKLVVANSLFTKGELLKLGVPEEKIVIIYPCPNTLSEGNKIFARGLFEAGRGRVLGVNIRAARPVASVASQPSSAEENFSSPSVLLTVARLVKRKGIDTVIKALPEVLKLAPNIQYVIVGGGPEFKNLKLEIENLGLGDKVKLLGEVSDEELVQWYGRADLFILTPRQINGDVEGFGTVYLEANSYSVPVIGSRTGGVPEAVEDGVSGLLVEPEHVDQVARAIIRLLTDKSLASTMGERGKNRVEAEFQWEKQISKLVSASSF